MKIAIFAYSHGGCAAARRVRAVLAEAETVCYAVPRLEEAVSYTHLTLPTNSRV